MAAVGRSARPPYDVDAVVDVAVAVFLEHGYDAASMRDVAQAAGLSPSSIYHHVSGKDQLLAHAVQRALDELFAVLDEPEAVTGTPLERLQHIVRRTSHVVVARLPEVALLLRVRGNSPAERDALKRRRSFDRAVEQLIAEGMKSGELTSDVPVKLGARLIFGMVNSISEWYRSSGEFSADDIADAIEVILVRGMTAPRTPDGQRRR